MIEIIKNLNNNILDLLDMTDKKAIDNEEYQNYYQEKSSKEHYRLLKYLSNQQNNSNILDIGSLKGCSALAFFSNITNNIYSFNIANQLNLKYIPKNINFIIDNILDEKYKKLIISCKIILLDTYHDGIFEKEFLDYLLTIQYKGYLLLDDIYLNPEMQNFWKTISLQKEDISNFGHSTGTGIIFLN